jgi:AraC-like DNA-binding protein
MCAAEARFLGAGLVAPDPRWRMQPHAHDFHEMIFVTRGRLLLEAAGRRHLCVPGDVLLYPARVVHAERSHPDDPLASVFLSFACAGIRQPDVVRRFDARGRMGQLARWLYEDRLDSGPDAGRGRRHLLACILAEFGRDAQSGDRRLVDAVRSYVHGHVGERITLDHLARVAGLSKYHFLRRYRDAAGRTPMEDVRAMRVAYARELILGTDLLMKEIAPRAGLGDQYAMSRLFHAVLGVSPRTLRTEAGRLPRGAARKA